MKLYRIPVYTGIYYTIILFILVGITSGQEVVFVLISPGLLA